MAAVDTIQYLTVPDYATNSALAAQQNMRIETLSRIRRTLLSDRPYCIEDCVVWARRCFEDLFSNKVRQLLHNFPLDRLTSTGTPFW
jgi:ubiquitin-activating enzyme E1